MIFCKKFANNNTRCGQQHLRPGLTIMRITQNCLFDTKKHSYKKIWGNSNKIVLVGCTQQ